MTDRRRPSVRVVVLAYGDEPLLDECVQAILASKGVDVEVVLVDNGCNPSDLARVRRHERIRLLEPGENTGYSGGCNLGARGATTELVAFVNSDAVVAPEALRRLAQALEQPEVGIATASVRLYDRPGIVNSAGNPVHFTGLSWSGGWGDDAALHGMQRAVTAASGCAMALRTLTWRELGGFWDPMFAYYEDAELSLRTWISGHSVVYVPDAVVLHDYEFRRSSATKFFLLERNRLILVLTVFQRRTLALVVGPLLALELAVALVALKQGWFRAKARGWLWLFRHRALLRERRSTVQAARRRSDAVLAPLLTADFTPGIESGLPSAPALSRIARLYWQAVRPIIASLPNSSASAISKEDTMPDDTRGEEYADRLMTLQHVWWKRLIPVQAPYRWNLRRQQLGRTLDVGCGIGRNLASLPPGSVGVDHNPVSVQHARSIGLSAFTVEEFLASEHARPESFDGLLFAHVIEHLPPDQGEAILRDYLPYLRPGGAVVFICPQERGYASDTTHVRWTTGDDLVDLARGQALRTEGWRSFPFPRRLGRRFTYNEFVVRAVKD